jgi:hypothetical protein
MVGSQQLRELHQRLYEANERRIRELVSTPRRFTRHDLDRYEGDLAESIPSDWQPSTPAALRLAIRRARVILVGDYHSLKQSQRGFVRVLRAIRSKHLTVGLEFVSARYQKPVDDYVGGRIQDDVFLRRTEYARSWPSYQVWPNFRPIFEHAQKRKARVLALDCPAAECGTVWSRSAFAAWRIAESIRESPLNKVAVLMGEAHLAPNHLPLELARALERLGIRASVLTIHQNLDPLWFELMERGLQDSVDAVRLDEDRFVVPVSTPIAAQASFLAAMSGEEAAEAGDRAAVRREFMRYLVALARFIGVRATGILDGVTVCGPGDLAPLQSLESRLDPDTFRMLVRHVESGESLCMPSLDLVYLAHLGPTHLGEEAAHFLKSRLASGELPEDPSDFFYGRSLHEAIGYFGAKVFNPKRKPPSESLLRHIGRNGNAESGIDDLSPELAVAVQLAGWHRTRQWRRTFVPDSFDLHLKALGLQGGLGDLGPDLMGPVVHLLGYEMGERLWTAFRAGRIPASSIRDLFLADLEVPGAAFTLWHGLASTLRSIRLPTRF